MRPLFDNYKTSSKLATALFLLRSYHEDVKRTNEIGGYTHYYSGDDEEFSALTQIEDLIHKLRDELYSGPFEEGYESAKADAEEYFSKRYGI